jgi:GTP-binding protein EngB required for normal cell division
MKISYNIPISGRPNAGKTTLINYLTQSKYPVGKRAGTTLRITPIPLIRDIFLVDLPGFGRITRRSRKLEDQLKDQIVQFLDDPANSFFCGIHIIDISTFHIVTENLEKKGIIPIDIEMIRFIDEVTSFPPFVVFNKIDKVSSRIKSENIQLLQDYSLPMTSVHCVSLRKNLGCREFRNALHKLIVGEFGPKYQKW